MILSFRDYETAKALFGWANVRFIPRVGETIVPELDRDRQDLLYVVKEVSHTKDSITIFVSECKRT
jgi:hypothetical protein